VLILNNKQEAQREALWRDFADFMTKEGFYTLMDAYTEDNEILIVDTSNPTAKPWEILHWFKADDPGAFSSATRSTGRASSAPTASRTSTTRSWPRRN
jgi:hypothetical protein